MRKLFIFLFITLIISNTSSVLAASGDPVRENKTIETTIDIGTITDTNIPYMSANGGGFADSPLTRTGAAEATINSTIKFTDGTDTTSFGMKTQAGEDHSNLTIGLDEDDRNLIICDAGDVGADFGLSASVNPILAIVSADLSNYITINTSTLYTTNSTFSITAPDGITNRITTTVGEGNVFLFDSGDGDSLVETNAEQAWVYIEPKIKQTSTGAYDALKIKVDETLNAGNGTSGYGNNLILAGTTVTPNMFKVDNTGIVTSTAMVTAPSATPAIEMTDSNTDMVAPGIRILGDATTVTENAEIYDLTLQAMGATGTAGTLGTFLQWDGSAKQLVVSGAIVVSCTNVTCADATDTCVYTASYAQYWITSGTDSANDTMVVSAGTADGETRNFTLVDGTDDVVINVSAGTDTTLSTTGDSVTYRWSSTKASWYVI